jgi:hypothetical protein
MRVKVLNFIQHLNQSHLNGVLVTDPCKIDRAHHGNFIQEGKRTALMKDKYWIINILT